MARFARMVILRSPFARSCIPTLGWLVAILGRRLGAIGANAALEFMQLLFEVQYSLLQLDNLLLLLNKFVIPKSRTPLLWRKVGCLENCG